MKIDIRFRHIEGSQGLRDHVSRRLHFQLSRFGRAIELVRVRLSDVNGPRGGTDKRCRIAVRVPQVGVIAIEQHSDDAYGAIDGAVDRLARRVGHAIARARWSRRIEPRLA